MKLHYILKTMKLKYPQMKNTKDYSEYKLHSVINMSPEAFGDLLSNEIYNLVLVYRLLDLKCYFLENELYEYCYFIQCWSDEHNVNLDVE
jgi:hypothetical protein